MSTLRVLVVGTCGSGKTTLVERLGWLGIQAGSVAQEHSEAQHLWMRRRPDFLIVLDCGYERVRTRRRVSWPAARLEVERRRLAHARQNCQLFLQTDDLTIEDVVGRTLAAIDDYLRETRRV